MQILSCVSCSADFSVIHDMDFDIYKPTFCVFCGEEIVNDEDDMNFDSTED